MQGKYEIYWRKDQNGTPNQPISPRANITASPQNQMSTVRKGALIGLGALAARKAFNTVRQEIAATGNERLQNRINNVVNLVGAGAAIAIGGWVAAGALGVGEVFNQITYVRNLQRTNTESLLEADLKSKRVNIAKGSVYYD